MKQSVISSGGVCMLASVDDVSAGYSAVDITPSCYLYSDYLNLLQGNRRVAQQVPGLVYLTELTASDLLLNLEVCQWVMAHIWLQWFLKDS